MTTLFVRKEKKDKKEKKEKKCPRGQKIFTTISTAIAYTVAHPTKKYIIRVAAGVYKENLFIPPSLTNITLLGAQAGIPALKRFECASSGGGRIICPKRESIIIPSSPTGFLIQGNNIIVDGFTIQDNIVGPGITTTTGLVFAIVNNIFQSNVSGLYLNTKGQAQGSLVRKNVFNSNNNPGSNSENGIWSSLGLSNVKISKNFFTGHRGSSILLIGQSVDGSVKKILITKNLSTFDAGFQLIATKSVTITKNIIKLSQLTNNSGGRGVTLFGGTKKTVITCNEIISNAGRGIEVSRAHDPRPNTELVVHKNNISYNGSDTAVPVDTLPTGLGIREGAYVGVLDAKENFWGPLSCPPGEPVTPNNIVTNAAFPQTTVVLEPFLTAPPSCAPGSECKKSGVA